MQQESLIRSARKGGPDVWQFRWADRGLYGKRIYRKRVIGTACQYADADSARRTVTGLLRKINAKCFSAMPSPDDYCGSVRSLCSARTARPSPRTCRVTEAA